MKPLTKDELWLLERKVTQGHTINLWMVRYPHITHLRMVPPKLLYVNDDPEPLRGWDFGVHRIEYPIFGNYWHAYAYKLRQGGQ